MKKIIAMLLVLVMALSLVARGGGDSASDVKTYKVGVAIYQYNDNLMTL